MVVPAKAEAALPHRPRILALVMDAFGGQGGIAKCMENALSAIAELPEGPLISVISRSALNHRKPIPVSVSCSGFAGKGKLAFGLEIARQALFGAKPTLIFCGHIHLMPFAHVIARRFKAPVALYLHGIEAWRPPAGRAVRRLASRASLYIAVSEVTRERFLEWSQVEASKVQVVPNPVRMEDFGARPKDRRLLRKHGLEGKQVLMTLCRLDSRQRHKGVDEVIEVLGALIQEHPSLVYLVAGSGDDSERLRQKARALGLADRVLFTGWVAEDEKADLYSLADAFVLAGYGDGFGIVLLEAMACGLPVVASSLDGTRTAVLDGKLGQIVNPTDPEDLVRGISKALHSPRRVPERLSEFSYPGYRNQLSRLLGPLLAPAVVRQ